MITLKLGNYKGGEQQIVTTQHVTQVLDQRPTPKQKPWVGGPHHGLDHLSNFLYDLLL